MSSSNSTDTIPTPSLEEPSASSIEESSTPSFKELGLPSSILKSLTELGYESPSPIQAASIPVLQSGRDLLGQAQTGTGKTAAFALPLLTLIDLGQKHPQLLVLAPTRELAIQVAEAFQRYARHLGCSVLPIYGGQSYDNQLRQLKRGVQIVVGTPGRVMDHIRRKTLKLDKLQSLVLDEADEMLRMGFIDDVEWILEHTPAQRQIALFSATMPKEIKKVADQYLKNPKHIKIASKTETASTIHQQYLIVHRNQKLDALTRILELEDYDGIIVFVRTKVATIELAEKLAARGYRSEALNGDIAQQHREKIVDKLKKNRLDILVATDVVARGLDVDRVSHVINYDIPLDTESYVHRIGRTGRAGRDGDAIVLVTPREKHLLKAIERANKSPMTRMDIPSTDDVNQKRVSNFKQLITNQLKKGNLELYETIITEYLEENPDISAETLLPVLAAMAQGDQPLLIEDIPEPKTRHDSKSKKDRQRSDRDGRRKDGNKKKKSKDKSIDNADMERYRIEIGHNDGVKPGNIVGAIANEADISSKFIGHIKINDDHSLVDLPKGMPKDVFRKLQKAYICGKPANINLEKK